MPDEPMPNETMTDMGQGNLPDLKPGQPPPEGDPRVGTWFYEQFLVAKKFKDKGNWHGKWLRNHELVRGKHYKHRNPSKSKYPLVPVNLFHVAHSTTKANLTDRKPKFDITPHSETAKERTPVMHSAAGMWWKRTGQQKTLSDSVGNSEKYGSTLEKMLLNAQLEAGKGEIEAVVVDPFKFFPWPNVKDIQSMPMFFEIDVWWVPNIKRTWGEVAEKVEAEGEWSNLLGRDREDVRGGSLSESRHSDNLPNDYTTGEGKDIRTQLEQAMVIECWCKDYTMEDVIEDRPVLLRDEMEQPIMDESGMPLPMVDDAGNPVTEQVVVGQKPKYPGFIRCVHITNSGKVVLDDMPNPSINPNLPPERAERTYLWDKYPYIKGDSYSDDTNFWGYSIVEQIEVLILEINKKISQIAAYIDKTVRPPLIMPKSAGIPDSVISNLPGQKWRPTNHMAAREIRYLSVPNLPSDFYKYLELLLKLVDIITGIHDVTEGRKPAGVTAASAIMALQEKAETIFRDKIRNLDLIIEARGRMWISLAQNWYTEPRMVMMSGRDASVYGEFPQFQGSDLPFDDEFSFEVVSGSTMPKSMFAMREQAIQLYQGGAIDQREVLTVFEWPRIEEVIQRMSMGPLGQLVERLEIAGMPPDFIEAVKFVGGMSDNDFRQNFQKQPVPMGGSSITPAQAGKK